MKRWILITAAGAAVLGSAGCVNRAAQQQAARTAQIVTDPVPNVTVQPARTESMTEELEITGDIVSGEDTSVGAKQSGKIVSIYVRDGDTVSSGQLLASLDTSQLVAQMRQSQALVGQAQAGMRQAVSALAQARRNAAVGPSRTSSAVRSAEAQVRSAKAQLQKALNGARPEERRQAEANVEAAQTELETQKKELERVRILVREGALAANRLDQQQNLVAAAQTRYQNAVEALNLVKAGAREEDINSAREAVRQAEEALRTAQAQKQLDPLLQDQIRAAEAQVSATKSQLEGAQAQVAIVQQNISDMQVRAPFSGKVYGKPAQPGTVVSPGAQIVRLIGGSGTYFSGQIPATSIHQVRSGLPVQVTIDGIPGKSFSGTVATVSPIGESVGRLFSARVEIAGGPGVKPGMFARGIVALRTIQNATVVPVDAVVGRGQDKFVYYVEGDVAKEAKVTTGVQKGIWVQVTGVPMGARIVVDGQQNLRDGVKVKIEDKSASKSDGSKESGT